MSTSAEQFAKTLWGDVTRYQKIRRIGEPDCAGILDGPVWVQEKVDGANLTVGWDFDSDSPVIATRNRVIHNHAGTRDDFRGAVEYVLGHDGILSALREGKGLILRGEWLVKHTIIYPSESLEKFYLFDVQLDDGRYLPWGRVQELSELHGIECVPTLNYGEFTADQLREMMVGESLLGAPAREGIVIKNYSWQGGVFGRVHWAKLVSSDFQESKQTPNESLDVETQFSAQANRELVLKSIHKIESNAGRKLILQDMRAVMGMVWADLIQENMFPFWKKVLRKKGGGRMDFHRALRLVSDSVRGVVLEYMNDAPSTDAA